ncbi:energy transducer TonB [Persicimonas caeni]|uniref:Energy transducer TonB n=1 Tax=Persicimonas caeni TaxID=2292766 RepID=A0A4Y6PZE5_PERCE|nr:AgmX/PglI C-terminal domain-containing protein [Persicimonas caeni]QDG53642.1 energy transducer TonB [Persicimonas caeni]QED34863.1 energy transducer TonB [Persicimonas caeni]
MKQHLYVKLTLITALAAATTACTATNQSLQEDTGPPPRKETITAVHSDTRPELRDCFETSAADGVTEVEVELQLPRSGTPASIRLLDPETLSPELRTCLETAFADLEYGEGRSGSTYYQVLTWDSQSQKIRFEDPVDAYHRWGLTGDEIESVFEVHETRVDQCYKVADNDPEGRVVLTVAIDSDGRVSRAGIKSSTLGAPSVEDCLVDFALESEFPPPRGGGVVVFDLAFRFRAGEGWVR